MGSIMMHLCISSKIKDKYHFGDNFLIGAILPDIYKKTIMDNEGSHYLIKTKENGKLYCLPDLNRYVKENKQKLSNEIYIGYYAHLLEDYIWGRYFSNQFAKQVLNSDGERYLYKDEDYKIIHTEEEYREMLYKDYTYWDNAIFESLHININEYKDKVKEYLNHEKYDCALEEIIVHKSKENEKNRFITEEMIRRYIKTSTEFFDMEFSKLHI